MRICEETKRIYIRQSWLKDALLCPERSRLEIQKPEFKTLNDSAAIGTAVHAAIENIIVNSGSVANAQAIGIAKFTELEETTKGGIRQTNIDPNNYKMFIQVMVRAFQKDILPFLPTGLGALTEYKFSVPTNVMINDYELWFEGTIDYLHPQAIWDWKTSSRKYSEYEKQASDIQSTIYHYAATSLGLLDPDIPFKFGVLVRTHNAYGQIVTVQRNQTHANFVISQAKSMVEYAMGQMDPEITPPFQPFTNKWLANDQHHLCSSRWCPWWAVCKGAHISDSL